MPGERVAAQRELLERMSRTVEANPDADARTIRKRAGVSRQVGDAFLEMLLKAGFLERKQVNAEWRYRSVKPYRLSVETPRAEFGATHSTRQGGGG